MQNLSDYGLADGNIVFTRVMNPIFSKKNWYQFDGRVYYAGAEKSFDRFFCKSRNYISYSHPPARSPALPSVRLSLAKARSLLRSCRWCLLYHGALWQFCDSWRHRLVAVGLSERAEHQPWSSGVFKCTHRTGRFWACVMWMCVKGIQHPRSRPRASQITWEVWRSYILHGTSVYRVFHNVWCKLLFSSPMLACLPAF